MMESVYSVQLEWYLILIVHVHIIIIFVKKCYSFLCQFHYLILSNKLTNLQVT